MNIEQYIKEKLIEYFTPIFGTDILVADDFPPFNSIKHKVAIVVKTSSGSTINLHGVKVITLPLLLMITVAQTDQKNALLCLGNFISELNGKIEKIDADENNSDHLTFSINTPTITELGQNGVDKWLNIALQGNCIISRNIPTGVLDLKINSQKLRNILTWSIESNINIITSNEQNKFIARATPAVSQVLLDVTILFDSNDELHLFLLETLQNGDSTKVSFDVDGLMYGKVPIGGTWKLHRMIITNDPLIVPTAQFQIIKDGVWQKKL